MSRISIKGVIVPSVYDDEWMADAISKGKITPLSRVEQALAEASKTEPLEISINSPGGSVFSAHEMVNAIVDWRNATGQTVNITVGAMAASAASTISVMLGPVRAHQNAMFMFHSAYSEAFGGPEHMLDEAELLQKINRQVVTSLVTKYKADPEEVAEWFSEGRMGWLTATEAQEIGLVSEIIPANAEGITFARAEIGQFEERGLAIAALLELDATGEAEMIDKLIEVLNLEGEQTEETILAAVQSRMAELAANAEAAYDEGKAAGKEEASAAVRAEVEAEWREQLDAATAEFDGCDKERAELAAKLEEANAELEGAKERIQKLDKGFRSGGENTEQTDTEAYWAAVGELVENGATKQAAMLNIQRNKPELYKAMIDEANRE